MISEKKLNDSDIPCDFLEVPPMSSEESKLMLMNLDPDMIPVLEKVYGARKSDDDSIWQLSSLLKSINGNCVLLKIVAMVFQFGGEALL